MLIREATPADVEAMHAMICELATYERAPDAVLATATDLHDHLFSSTPHLFAVVAEDVSTGETVGMAIWFLNYSTWLGRHGIYLEDLYVRQDARGRGIGEALLRHLAQICTDRGYGRLEWWVLDWLLGTPEAGAAKLYNRIGAEPMRDWVPMRLAGDSLFTFASEPQQD
jgi:GNAT superfamily N-acetyltransferase